ncbi:MAG TPA: bifunctional diaminohydroxyphosphoribosylaminopyrimidine deaminase/5-amino-6-(5-phosphoribosylamino)uracil reductase RibD [Bacteroidales bacterium]|nr:bifunctional diaminohydroxyphosphoribosylaminopyrimidine deaminase/5-amino-6-(5-phosphoribosylamino)uracil reductase RibD [Bacteroidales bacterium]
MSRFDDRIWMERALQIAALGLGTVQPNPMVGAVIVHEDKIIGEGWHRKYGEPHAEVHAINRVTDKSLLLKSTLYVTLEPCSHYGKTPPCAELICKHHIPRVVIANKDPNKKVNGTGIQLLMKNGIDVQTGILAQDGLTLNKRFFTFHLLKRPYIILKWAETKNGFMDIPRDQPPVSYWITNQELTIFSHKLRNEEQAILIGYNTYQNDKPRLTNRLYGTKQPFPFVCSNDVLQTPPIPFTVVPNQIPQLLQELFIRNIQSVIIEGGKKTLLNFLEAGIWDEIILYQGNQEWEDGLPSPKKNIADYNHYSEKSICGNKIHHYVKYHPLMDAYTSFNQ